MSKIYAVYDMKDNEQCIGIFDKTQEVANYFNMTKGAVLSEISRGNKIKHRYKIERINDIEEDLEQDIISKTKEEIFKELIDAFIPEKHNFQIYDDFKDEIKHRMDMIIINEQWKPIKDFNYLISNYGRIRNNTTNKIKELRVGRFGYQINLWNKGKGKMFTISRLVANYFIREVKDNERVKHKDGDIRNNYYKNLEIVSK